MAVEALGLILHDSTASFSIIFLTSSWKLDTSVSLKNMFLGEMDSWRGEEETRMEVHIPPVEYLLPRSPLRTAAKLPSGLPGTSPQKAASGEGHPFYRLPSLALPLLPGFEEQC